MPALVNIAETGINAEEIKNPQLRRILAEIERQKNMMARALTGQSGDISAVTRNRMEHTDFYFLWTWHVDHNDHSDYSDYHDHSDHYDVPFPCDCGDSCE